MDFLFKISDNEVFLAHSFNQWLTSITGATSIFLPLAISFYSFVFIAYTIDVYQGKIQEKENFLEYFTFIFYFPHLVAGPIIRHSDFFYQLKNPIPLNGTKIANGIYLILQGMLKKLIIADNVSLTIQPIFADPSNFNTLSAWMAVLGYAVRVYCDFSGYTDIARGISKMLGLELPENFLAPYLTTNVRDLWKKWHYTLATWIRDYIYIPLGGSKTSEIRSSLNLILAFTIGGLWHGANYTFIAWGAWNGFMIAIERKLSLIFPFLNSKLVLGSTKKENLIYYIYIFLGFFFTQWVFFIGTAFFNSESIAIAIELIKSMHYYHSGKMASGGESLIYAYILTLFFNFLQKKNWEGWKATPMGIIGLVLFGILSMLLLGLFTPEGVEFIYFQF